MDCGRQTNNPQTLTENKSNEVDFNTRRKNHCDTCQS